ncbi:hypothetical protein KFK09_012494 [Dendrobium nobile]|uniref:DUF4283 domain-containing protein n=1 Tax=Dendrobium nobile TaxID=94219 RepID=A0A8T3BHV7_DENNO|nr:hypothetical protein KFK09_012494 [Dendrobium nobile]
MKLIKWTLDIEVASHVMSIWISFPNLRPRLFAPRILHDLGFVFGKPLKINNSTSSGSRPSVARILVELYVTKHYPDKIWIGPDNIGYVQYMVMEDFPQYYAHSFSFGQSKAACRILPPHLDSSALPMSTLIVNNMMGEGGDVALVLPDLMVVSSVFVVVAPDGIVCDDSAMYGLVVNLDVDLPMPSNSLVSLVVVSPVLPSMGGYSVVLVDSVAVLDSPINVRLVRSSPYLSPAAYGPVVAFCSNISLIVDGDLVVYGAMDVIFLVYVDGADLAFGKSASLVDGGEEASAIVGKVGVEVPFVDVSISVISNANLFVHLARDSVRCQCDWLHDDMSVDSEKILLIPPSKWAHSITTLKITHRFHLLLGHPISVSLICCREKEKKDCLQKESTEE